MQRNQGILQAKNKRLVSALASYIVCSTNTTLSMLRCIDPRLVSTNLTRSVLGFMRNFQNHTWCFGFHEKFSEPHLAFDFAILSLLSN